MGIFGWRCARRKHGRGREAPAGTIRVWLAVQRPPTTDELWAMAHCTWAWKLGSWAVGMRNEMFVACCLRDGACGDVSVGPGMLERVDGFSRVERNPSDMEANVRLC